MTAAGWDPPPEVSDAPAGDGGGLRADCWLDADHQGTTAVCQVLYLPGIGPIQCRSTVPWTPARGLRLRAEAAARMPPLPSGHRDPDGPRSDAPDRNWRPRDAAMWDLAARLADTADDTDAGMSQREIAATAGVGQMTVSRSLSDSDDSDDDHEEPEATARKEPSGQSTADQAGASR